MSKIENRETYLQNAITELRPRFISYGFPIPKLVKVTCGWPSKSAGRSNKRRIGECWYPDASADKKTTNIIVSMVIDNAFEAIEILIHELDHAATPGHGHKGDFRKLAGLLGLEGKMTSTRAGERLAKEIKAIVKKLGKYPHSKIDFDNRKKQSTRMKKHQCLDPSCGAIWYASRKWFPNYCPVCSGLEID